MEHVTPCKSHFELEKSYGDAIMDKSDNIKLWYNMIFLEGTVSNNKILCFDPL